MIAAQQQLVKDPIVDSAIGFFLWLWITCGQAVDNSVTVDKLWITLFAVLVDILDRDAIIMT